MLRAQGLREGQSFLYEAPLSSKPVDSPSDGSVNGPAAPPTEFSSCCHIGVARGSGITLWHGVDHEAGTEPECKVQLSPDRPAIIGRSEGREIYYLDPTYRPTRL